MELINAAKSCVFVTMLILNSFPCEQQILKKMTGYIATVRRQGTLQGSTHYRRPDYSPNVIHQYYSTGSNPSI